MTPVTCPQCGSDLLASVETLHCFALCTVVREADGAFEIDWHGDTEIDWNSQSPVEPLETDDSISSEVMCWRCERFFSLA